MSILRGFKKITGHPAFFLAVIALLTSVIVQSGGLGSIDASKRLQVARSFWTQEPPVVQEAGDGDFGVRGRDGKLQAWFGMGQSLLMLPADMIASTLVESIPSLQAIDQKQNGMLRRALVAYQISPLVCTLGVLVSFYLLELLGFSVHQAIAGALALLFATTFLHYTQVAQENNFILLLTLLGFYSHYRWFREGRQRWLILGAVAFGFNLLTRMTTALDLLAGALFICACLWRAREPSRLFIKRLLNYTLTCLIVYGTFALIDRLYHYRRFGTFSGTYIHLFGEKWKLLHPELPASFPFSTPFSVGFFGPLISAEKSIFIFDPLIIVTLLLFIRYRKQISFDVKIFILSLLTLLLAYLSFYATYFDWSGDAAWGDRFITTPVQLLAMMSLPLLFRYYQQIKNAAERIFYYAVMAVSVVIQIASVTLSYNLEIIQRATSGRSRFVVGARLTNLFAMATGTFETKGLGAGIPERLTQISLMPFGPARELPATVNRFLVAIWIALLMLLMVITYIFMKKILRGDYLRRV